MQVSGQTTISSLFLIADAQGQVQQHLRSHVPAAAAWTIQTYASAAEASQVAPYEAPDLAVVVCEQVGDLLCSDLLGLLEHAKLHWPHTFFILASARPLRNLETLLERFGELPAVDLADAEGLSRSIEREMGQRSHGSVRGVSLPGFLQMMEWEQKSLSIRVASGERWGRLHLLSGRLVGAYSRASGAVGEAAALDILAWEGVLVTIERSYHNRNSREGGAMRPLTALLMDAMRQKDEDAREGGGPQDFFLDDDAAAPEASLPSAPPLSDPSPPPGAQTPGPQLKENIMANVKETLVSVMNIEGANAAALVEYGSGMTLGTMGTGVDLELAAAGNSDVVRAKLRTMEALGINGQIEDILITLQDQYHVIHLIRDQGLFLYLVLKKESANLAMARYKLRALAKDIAIA